MAVSFYGFWVLLCLSIFFSPNSLKSMHELMLLLPLMCAFFLGRVVTHERAWYRVFLCVFVSSVVVSLYYLMQLLGFDPFLIKAENGGAPASFFSNANNCAVFFVVSVLSAIGCAAYVGHRTHRFLLLAFSCVFILLLVRNGSVAAIVSLCVGLLFGGALYVAESVKKWRVVCLSFCSALLGTLVLAILWSFLFPMIGEGLTMLFGSDTSVVHRQAIWQTALALIGDSPWLGSGVGMYELLHPRYQAVFLQSGRSLFEGLAVNAHNTYLEIAVDAGLMGVALFVTFCGCVFMQLFLKRDVEKCRGNERALHICTFAICFSILAFALFHSVLLFPVAGVFLFLFFGMVVPIHPAPVQSNIVSRFWRGCLFGLFMCSVVVFSLRVMIGSFLFQSAFMANKAGNIDAASHTYVFAQKWKTFDYKCYENYGNVLMRQGKFAQAEHQFQLALRKYPYSVNCLNSMGVLRYQVGDYVQAEEYLHRAIVLNPLFVGAYVNLGLVMKSQGNNALALVFLREAEQLAPEDISIKKLLKEIGGA